MSATSSELEKRIERNTKYLSEIKAKMNDLDHEWEELRWLINENERKYGILQQSNDYELTAQQIAAEEIERTGLYQEWEKLHRLVNENERKYRNLEQNDYEFITEKIASDRQEWMVLHQKSSHTPVVLLFRKKT